MKKIRLISQFFYLLFCLIFIAMPVIAAVFWTYAPATLYLGQPSWGFSINEIPKGVTVMHRLSAETKFFAFCINLVPLLLKMTMVNYLIGLFALFRQGELFTLNNVKCIKRVGIFLFLWQLVHPFYQAAISALLTYGNPAGHRYAIASLTGTNIGLFLTAILIVLISWIMTEGCKLQEENKLTV